MADNQKTFYESTSKNLDTMRAMMQEILEMQRNLYNDQRKAQQDSKDKKSTDLKIFKKEEIDKLIPLVVDSFNQTY